LNDSTLTSKTLLFIALTILITGTLSVNQFVFAQSDIFYPRFSSSGNYLADRSFSNDNGVRMIQMAEYENALLFLNDTLKTDPNHNAAIYNKGLVFLELDKPDEVLVWFEKNQDVEPKDISTLNDIGRILLKLEKPEEALVWFDKALEIDPNTVYILNNKGNAFYGLGQYDEAISYYDRALEIDPNDELVKNNKELAKNNKELAKNNKEFFKNDKDPVLENEKFDYDTIQPFVIFATVGITSYFMYYIKKRRQKHIRKAGQIIHEPSFSVLKIRWTGSNITYLVIFDKERILFIRPDKISAGRLDWSLDEILKMDKYNFEILYDEITTIELNHSTAGVNGARAGKMIISYKNHQNSFDILVTESFEYCKKLIMDFLPSKLLVT